MSEDDTMDITQVIAHLTGAVIELHDRTTLANAVAGVLHIAIKTVLLATHNDTEKATQILKTVITQENVEKIASESFYIELVNRELH